MTTETKKALICTSLGLGLAWLIVYLVKKEKAEEPATKAQPPVTDESVTIAVNAYKGGIDDNATKEELEKLNTELKSEFGLTVEFRPLQNKYMVYDLSGKKVREL